jgi:DNA-directed RNA polymerase specialized sigma24 family protein
MAENNTQLSKTVRQALQGDEQASRLLVEAWGPVLRHVVRRCLSQKLRSQVDTDDLVQDVWTWFAAHRTSSQLPDQPEGLLHLLTKVAHDMAVDTNRHFDCTKSDLNHTQRLNELTVAEAETLVGHEPAPIQIASRAEDWARLQRSRCFLDQLILELLRDGYTYPEIAEVLSRSEKSIQRVVRLAREEVSPAEPALSR